MIVAETPECSAGQKGAIGLALPKMGAIHMGLVGLGMCGPGVVERSIHILDAQAVALRGYEQERVEQCQKYLE